AVYRYCRIALGDTVLADDVHQQVFIEAFRDLPGFAGRSTLRTWLFGIARHRVLDAAKRRRRARAHLDITGGADLPDPRPSPAGGRGPGRRPAAGRPGPLPRRARRADPGCRAAALPAGPDLRGDGRDLR